MMFSENETYNIEEAKREIKSYIRSRSLLWNGLTRNVVIAGGFFTSVMQNKTFKDIDIFILDNDIAVYNELTERQWPATMWRRSEMMSYMHNTDILDVINNTRTQAQYILTKYKTREELIAHFDYKHCKVSYVPEDDKLYINRETYDCIKLKVLKWNNKQLDQPNQIYRKNNLLNQGWVFETDNTKQRSYLDEILDAVSNPSK